MVLGKCYCLISTLLPGRLYVKELKTTCTKDNGLFMMLTFIFGMAVLHTFARQPVFKRTANKAHMPTSKNAYKRYRIIHNFLTRYNATKAELLDRLKYSGCEISGSMLEKDISAMRNDFDQPIEFNHSAKYYYYADPDASFDFPLDDEDIKTIFEFINRTIFLSHSSAYISARAALGRVMNRLEINLESSGYENNRKIRRSHSGPDCSHFTGLVNESIACQRRIRFTSLQDDPKTEHLIEPYELKEISGRLYLMGSEGERVAVYRLDKIEELVMTGEHFEIHRPFRNILQKL